MSSSKIDMRFFIVVALILSPLGCQGQGGPQAEKNYTQAVEEKYDDHVPRPKGPIDEAFLPALAAGPAQLDSPVVPLLDSPVWGAESAPVTVMLFSNFGCGHCRRASTEGGNVERIKKHFGPTRVRLVFKHVALDFPGAGQAHRASIAAHRQGKFWALHDELFTRELEGITRNEMIDLAQSKGLDRDRFARDFDDPSVASLMARDLSLVDRLLAATPRPGTSATPPDILGTPSYLINGRGAPNNFEDLKKAIDAEFVRYEAYQESGKSLESFYAAAVEESTRDLVIPAPTVPDPAERVPPTITIQDPQMGSPRASVNVLIFSDFQSDHCRQAAATLRQLYQNHPTDVRLVFFPMPVNDYESAHLTAQAALAMHEQARFWDFHDALFEEKGALSRPRLEAIAERVGGDVDALKKALDEGTFKDAVNRRVGIAQSLGVDSVPLLFVGGEEVKGAFGLDVFEAAFARQKLLADALEAEGIHDEALQLELFKAINQDVVAP